VPWDFAVDATTDACIEYASNPHRFEPPRASIVDFAYLIARRNLLNRVRSEAALKQRERKYVTEWAVVHDSNPQIGRLENALWIALISVTIDSRERLAAERWLDEAGNDAIAHALGVGGLRPEEQLREVKRFKDRLLKRLSRYFRPRPDPESSHR
jgi:DNA-directed RNA polymerase specialized sigma24 family protein